MKTKQILQSGADVIPDDVKGVLERVIKTKKLTPADAEVLYTNTNLRGFTTSGNERLTKIGTQWLNLKQALRPILKEKLPEFIEQTEKIARTFPKSAAELEPIQRFLRGAVWPTAISAGIGIPLYAALSRALGMRESQ